MLLLAGFVGILIGRKRAAHPLDGHFFSNTLSISIGFYLYGQAADVFGIEPEFVYWDWPMWLVQVCLAPPLYARAYNLGGKVGTNVRRTG